MYKHARMELIVTTEPYDIACLERDINKLHDISSGIEKYGLTQSSIYLMGKYPLFSGTALASLGLESVGEETQAFALEAIDAEVKEKSAQWSARILSFFKDSTGSILEKINSLWESVKVKADALTSKVWDGVKASGEAIQAHPYKTILIALAAAAAAFGVIAFVGTALPVGVVTNGAMHAFMLRLKTMYGAIRLPFGKVSTTAVSDGRLILATVETAEQVQRAQSVSSLGWNAAAVKATVAHVDRIVAGAKKGVDLVWNRILKPSEKVIASIILAPKDLKDVLVEKTGMRTVGWAADKIIPALYYSLLYKLIHNLWDVAKEIVAKSIKMVKDTFSSLSRALA